jgi:hypothetical protein
MEMLVEIAGDDPQVLQKRVFEWWTKKLLKFVALT